MSSAAELASVARDNASPARTGSYNIFVIRHSVFVIFPLVIRAKTALVFASRFAARLRSARVHGRDARATWLTIEMRNRYLLMSILALVFSATLVSSAFGAETAAPAQVEHEGVPLKAAPIVEIGKFAITNSMLVTWIVAAGIIVF